ncbi:protein disulfide-isomerase TMX3-like [Paramormyrops kingsleyae]|uniref:Protein disulfide-isomerase TMX3 n=1 Tax=Paramormyrops kingsleyae TaxID=1676925 RepID=A0A3B3SBE7_9TELE|nr:protein disulfide-isomerase TMX3-like [Paramormyrops kingsleyae]
MAGGKAFLLSAVCLWSTAVFAFVEELDGSFKDIKNDDVWLVDFYAPWCGYCKKLEPVWNDVGAELKRSGSPVRIGKMDATAFTGVASDFGVRGYPTIKLIKGEASYNYKGPRSKDAIIEFANRLAGPVLRSLPSKQMFEHVLRRHDVLFVYVGGVSPLKDKYTEMASELIVHTYFFSALEDVLPETVTLNEVPAVLVFKDGGHFVYDEYADGSLSSWVSRERFLSYLPIDGYTLYDLGDTGKLVAIVIIDEKNPTEDSIRLRNLVQRVATEYRDHYNRDVQFGHMDGSEYINSLIMGEISVPSIIMLNATSEQYFLPKKPVSTLEELLLFINSVLDGTAEGHGGDGVIQRVKRLAYDAKSTVQSVFRSSPILGCFLFGLPVAVISLMCYVLCTASAADDGTEDLKQDEEDEDEEDEEDEGQGRPALLDTTEETNKSIMDKKVD